MRRSVILSEAAALPPRRRRTSVPLLVALVVLQQPPAHYRHQWRHLLNDLRVTPGEIIATADTSLICMPGYANRVRLAKTPPALKAQVYANYGMRRSDSVRIPPPIPWQARDSVCCEIDHLISLELGGSNSIRNLWPEPYPDARAKDMVENALHWLVCHARLPLGVAQRGIARNWVRLRDSLLKAGNWVSWGAENVR